MLGTDGAAARPNVLASKTLSLLELQDALGKDFLTDEALSMLVHRNHEPSAVIRKARSVFAQSVRARSFGPALGKWVLVEHSSGFWVWVKLGDSVSMAILKGPYDPALTALVRSYLKPGGTFLDVGANVGWFTLFAASCYRPIGGRVIAFEPQRELHDRLRRSIEQNGWQDAVELHACALGDRDGAIQMVDAGLNSGGSSVVTSGNRPNFEGATMERLDVLCPNISAVDVIKLDIEGAEPLFLQGARAMLERVRPPIVSEIYPRKLRTVSGVRGDDYVGSVLDLGYDVATIKPDGSLAPFDWAAATNESLSFNVLFTPNPRPDAAVRRSA